MIKHIKIILAFILAIIISVSISVYATLQYSASQIIYGNTTLDHTLDDLYTKTNSFPNFSSATYSIDQGTTIPSRETSKSVSKGKYIILRNEATGWPISSTSSYTASSGAINKSITCDSNNCTITQISGYYNEQSSQIFGNYKYVISNVIHAFKVEIKDDSDVIRATIGTGITNNASIQYVTISVIPIN